MIQRHANLLITLFTIAVAISVVIHLVIKWQSITADAQRLDREAAIAARPAKPLAAAPFAPVESNAGTVLAVADANALGLRLLGVVVGRPASTSTALLAVSGALAKAFIVGDTLPGGAILDAIEFDLVVLRVNGQLQTLGFPKASNSSAASPASFAMAGRPAANGSESPDGDIVEPPDDSAGSGGGEVAGGPARVGTLSSAAAEAHGRAGPIHVGSIPTTVSLP